MHCVIGDFICGHSALPVKGTLAISADSPGLFVYFPFSVYGQLQLEQARPHKDSLGICLRTLLDDRKDYGFRSQDFAIDYLLEFAIPLPCFVHSFAFRDIPRLFDPRHRDSHVFCGQG